MSERKDVVSLQERYAEAAEEYAGEEATGGSFLTTRGGILKFGDEEMPGNQVIVVVVDSIRENAYYGEKFDPDNMMPPKCFAFGRREDDMVPHEDVLEAEEGDYFDPQSDKCKTCPMNVFGSAETGRGKACGNRRRLAIIPAGYVEKSGRDYDVKLFEDDKVLRDAEIAFLKLPVTSVKAWGNYVRQVAGQTNKPPFAVITRIWIERDSKTQFKIKFEMLEELPDEWAETVFARHDEARELIASPYRPPADEDDDD